MTEQKKEGTGVNPSALQSSNVNTQESEVLTHIASVDNGRFHRLADQRVRRGDEWKPRLMLCGRTLTPMNYFLTVADADKYTGGRFDRYSCAQCEARFKSISSVETPASLTDIGSNSQGFHEYSCGCKVPTAETPRYYDHACAVCYRTAWGH